LGLAEDSPLAAVVDVLLTAVDRELPADTALGHLFAVDSFTTAVSGEDRRWHSEPGTDLPGLAFVHLAHMSARSRRPPIARAQHRIHRGVAG